MTADILVHGAVGSHVLPVRRLHPAHRYAAAAQQARRPQAPPRRRPGPPVGRIAAAGGGVATGYVTNLRTGTVTVYELGR